MKKLLLGLSIPIIAATFLVDFDNGKVKGINKDTHTKQEVRIGTHSDFPVANSLVEMVDQSNYIVIGHYVDFDSKWNMARNSQDISKPDENVYIEGHLYNFKVDKVVKGDLAKGDIKVNIFHSKDINLRNDDGTTDKVRSEDSRYIAPDLGKKYVLFLNKDNNFDNYFASIEPFQIQIDKEGKALLKSNLITKDNKEFKSSKTIELKDKKVVVTTGASSIPDTITGTNIDKLIEEIEKFKK